LFPAFSYLFYSFLRFGYASGEPTTRFPVTPKHSQENSLSLHLLSKHPRGSSLAVAGAPFSARNDRGLESPRAPSSRDITESAGKEKQIPRSARNDNPGNILRQISTETSTYDRREILN
jgi:hypothetical protein